MFVNIIRNSAAVRVRRATLNGRPHLVAPLTLIVPGVLNGSKGPLLYPVDEIAKGASGWHNMPILVDHPTENGVPLSGRKPHVFNRSGIGVVRNPQADGKLTAEGWFDIARTKRISPVIYNKLLAGETIELSTGLYTDNENRSGIYNGRHYTEIARDHRADHLAVFEDKIGACSVADGCGVLANEQRFSKRNSTMGRRRTYRLDRDILPPTPGLFGQPTRNSQVDDEDDLLIPPTINWQENTEGNKSKKSDCNCHSHGQRYEHNDDLLLPMPVI